MVKNVLGKWGKLVIDISIYLTQLSICISYLYFIAEQVEALVCHYTTDPLTLEGYCGHKNMYIALLTIPVLPVSWIETYTFLSYFSMAGIGLAILALASMFGYMSTKAAHGNAV